MIKEQTKPDNYDEWWPCACVRRDSQGNMAKIKMHCPETTRCRVCGATRPGGAAKPRKELF